MSYTLILGTSSVEYTLDPTGSNTVKLIPKESVSAVSIQDGTNILTIKYEDNLSLSVDLTQLSNQPTWSGGNLAARQAALAAFNTWMVTSGGGGGGGDASAANQVTGNNSLSSIDTKTPTVGQKVMASSSPVVISSDQSAVPVISTQLPAAIGQTVSANSLPVVIASNQSAIPVSQSTAASVTDAGWPFINGELTDTNGTFTNGTQTNSVTTGVSIDGYDTATVTIQGTYGTASAVFEVSDDGGTTWFSVQGTRTDSPVAEIGYTSLTNIARMWTVSVQGCGVFRVRSTAVASGTANIRISVSSAPTASQTIGQNPILPIDGASAQTATVNNIIPNPSLSTATDVSVFNSGCVQVVSTGTGGTYIFEGSQDNINFQAVPVYSGLIATGTPTVAAITATASSLMYNFPISFKYLRLRIATTITGGSIQAFSIFKQTAWTPAFTQVAQATAANLNTTATIASGTVTTVSTVTSLTTLANGQTAHSSASTGAPVRIGGRILPATPDLTLVAGDASDVGITTGQQALTKDFSSAELDYSFCGSISNSTTANVFKAAAGASIRNYVTNIILNSDTLTAATEIVIKDTAITFSSQTIASNTITSAAVHDLKIGDQFVASASTITGLTAATVYYVLTVPSTTTLTLSATPNGSTLAISGTGVTATANRILFRTKLQTTSFGPTSFVLPTPLRGTPNGTLDFQTVTATVAGAVYYNISGYVGF